MKINDLNKIIVSGNRDDSNNKNISQKNISHNFKKVLGKRPNLLKTKNNNFYMPLKFSTQDKNSVTIKHSGDIGDLIYSLPVLRYYGGGSLYLNPLGLPSKKCDGTSSGFNPDIIKFIMPLLESQNYVTSCNFYQEQKTLIDGDYFRKISVNILNLCEKILYSYSVPFSETEKPWIYCEPKKISPFVFARSFRYRNDDVDYSIFVKNPEDCVFVGLPDEHQDFCEKFGKIPYYKVKSLLELAQVICGSEIFYGNQSSPMALAVAMHKPFVQENYKNHSDCMFKQPTAKYMS